MIKNKSIFGWGLMAFAVITLLALAPSASANVSGTLTVANCSGGGVIVTATSIDWLLPVGGGNGCIETGTLTNVTYSGGVLGSGETGTILDLTAPTTFPVVGFMTFTVAPGLTFDLTALGPGIPNTNCTGLAAGQSCAVFAGSPFILTATATGTSVTLDAMGTATDSSGVLSDWLGAFTTQIPGQTPAQIQAAFAPGGSGSVQNTYSGAFVATVVPEPATFGTMLFGGLLAVGWILRRKRA